MSCKVSNSVAKTTNSTAILARRFRLANIAILGRNRVAKHFVAATFATTTGNNAARVPNFAKSRIHKIKDKVCRDTEFQDHLESDTHLCGCTSAHAKRRTEVRRNRLVVVSLRQCYVRNLARLALRALALAGREP